MRAEINNDVVITRFNHHIEANKIKQKYKDENNQTIFLSNMHVRNLNDLKKLSKRGIDGVGAWISPQHFAMIEEVDIRYLDNCLTYSCFLFEIMERTLNIRLQYSKKVRMKNNNNKKGKPTWHSQHLEDQLI